MKLTKKMVITFFALTALVHIIISPLRAQEDYEIDEHPISNLHFMRGWSYYHSAKYNQAIGELMEARREEEINSISSYWIANSYFALEEYGHAYIELRRLRGRDLKDVKGDEVEEKIDLCRKHLSREEVDLYNKLVTP